MYWLSFFTFADSSFSPIPPDPLLAGLCSLHPKNWSRFALVATVPSVLGGIFGYWLGMYFSSEITLLFEKYFGLGSELQSVGVLYQQHAGWALFTAAFTPIPFKVFTVSAGIFSVPFMTLIIASVIGRGLRYYAVSYISARFGQVGLRRFKYGLAVVTIILVAGFLLYIFGSQ